MRNKEKVKKIIERYGEREIRVSFSKIYYDLTEDINSSILLSQIVYWSDRTKRSDGYFYKSYEDWFKEIPLTKYQIKRAATKLEDLGLIATKVKRVLGTPTLHYKVNMEALENKIIKHLNKSNNLTLESKETSSYESKETSSYKSKETKLLLYTEDYYKKNTTEDYNTTIFKKEKTKNKNKREKETKEIVTEIENKIGVITSYMIEDINDYQNTFDEPKEIIEKAIEIASDKNIKNWNYVKGILRTWKQQGVKKITDIKTKEENELNIDEI